MSSKAIVKSVLSGDSLLLRGRPGPQGQLPKERILNLADVSAPRMGSSTRDDEPWAFESREFLRTLTIGKEISFVTTHQLPPNDDTPRDFGHAEIAGIDLASEMLRNGWVKCAERKREPTEDDIKRKDIETEAKNAGKGLWNPQGPKSFRVNHSMPIDSQAFLSEHKGQHIDALIEQVRDGSTVRARLILSDGLHHIVNITLAGVRCPRASGRQGEPAEQWGDEARFFAESRILQRMVKIEILSMPALGPSPFQQSNNAPVQHTASIFIGNVLHPNGNIAEHLLAAGLARVVDWHAGMLGAQKMERLRIAERAAKDKRLCLYTSGVGGPADAKSSGMVATSNGHGRDFEAVVLRIWSGDQLSVLDRAGKERRLQLSSIRAPKGNDNKQAFYAAEAKEYLRKRLIGKTVSIHVDYIKPAEGEYEERECVTVRFGRQNSNIGEQLIEKGLATALRHKKDDENRSPDYDKLLIAEKEAVDNGRGVHSDKEQAPPRIGNASESAAKAQQFLAGFKRQGRMPAIVEYVAAGSRFRIVLQKENQALTLVLAGIRAPRAAPPPGRSPREKPEPFGLESADFSNRRYMQRDVEVEFEGIDKTGGFIGTLWTNKTENAAVELLRAGLATVHAYSADSLPWSKQLYEAEEDAKTNKRNIWSNHVPDDESTQGQSPAEDSSSFKTQYLDVIVSDVRTSPTLGFSVQILNTEGIASLEKLMHEFALHHKTTKGNPTFMPKQGELVSAKFSDGSWYRAKIRRSSPVKKEAEVTFIDYGNQDTIAFKDLRPLEPKFASLAPQAQDARLSFVKLPDATSEYGIEAAERFRMLCEGRKLVANIDSREGNLLHMRLIDTSNPEAANDSLACINMDLVREGLASIDHRGCKYIGAYPNMVSRLKEVTAEAKRERLGMFEFGDVEEDD